MPLNIEHEGKQITVYTEAEVQAKVDSEVAGLKVTNQNLKDEKNELKGKLDEQKEAARMAEEEKAKAAGDVDKLNRLMEERQSEERQKYEQLRSEIAKEKTTNALNDLVTELGVGGTKNEDLRDLISLRYQVEYDHETKQVNAGGKTLADLKAEISKDDRYAAYLAGSKASGGGSTGSTGAGGASNEKFGDYTPAELSEIRRTDPQRYETLRQTR